MPKLMLTTLKPASGGFGAWDWAEAQELEGAEDYADYEAMCHDNGEVPLRTDDLEGRVHNERGRVYKFDRFYNAMGELVPDCHYEMVWEENDA